MARTISSSSQEQQQIAALGRVDESIVMGQLVKKDFLFSDNP